MATKLNREALQHARKLIEGGDYVVDTDWSERQPSADQENRFLDRHDWDEYSKWYLAEESSEDRDNKGAVPVWRLQEGPPGGCDRSQAARRAHRLCRRGESR